MAETSCAEAGRCMSGVAIPGGTAENNMTALEPSLRAAGFSLRGLKQALAPAETGAPRGLKPAARFVLGNLALSYYPAPALSATHPSEPAMQTPRFRWANVFGRRHRSFWPPPLGSRFGWASPGQG